MAFVLDSSVALAWLLPDEANERTDALADRLEQENAHVPSIWSLEVGNALMTALRRKRISDGDFDRCISALSALPIEVDPTAGLAGVLSIARRSALRPTTPPTWSSRSGAAFLSQRWTRSCGRRARRSRYRFFPSLSVAQSKQTCGQVQVAPHSFRNAGCTQGVDVKFPERRVLVWNARLDI